MSSRASRWSAAIANGTPPAAASPVSAEMTRWESVSMISRTTSLIAPRFSHDSCPGSSAASITFRWMPLEKKSSPPISTITFVLRLRA